MYVTTTCNGEFETITVNRGIGGYIGTFPNAVIQCGDFGDGDTTAQQLFFFSNDCNYHREKESSSDGDGDRDGIQTQVISVQITQTKML